MAFNDQQKLATPREASSSTGCKVCKGRDVSFFQALTVVGDERVKLALVVVGA